MQIQGLAYNDTQYLDLYLSGKPAQAIVVCIHGGGFVSGGRDDERCRQSLALLHEAGFVCASVSYSLAQPRNRFAKWPQNLFDVADAIAFLHDHASTYGYDFSRFGLLGFSAGCCLANLYMQGGTRLFEQFGYQNRIFRPAALVGFYGPYDFSIRQAERQSADKEINRLHSPRYWLRTNEGEPPPPVLHFQGDADTVVWPDQHDAFQADCRKKDYDFKGIVARGFEHSFAPRDTNGRGESLDLGPEIVNFFSRHLASRPPKGSP